MSRHHLVAFLLNALINMFDVRNLYGNVVTYEKSNFEGEPLAT